MSTLSICAPAVKPTCSRSVTLSPCEPQRLKVRQVLGLVRRYREVGVTLLAGDGTRAIYVRTAKARMLSTLRIMRRRYGPSLLVQVEEVFGALVIGAAA